MEYKVEKNKGFTKAEHKPGEMMDCGKKEEYPIVAPMETAEGKKRKPVVRYPEIQSGWHGTIPGLEDKEICKSYKIEAEVTVTRKEINERQQEDGKTKKTLEGTMELCKIKWLD